MTYQHPAPASVSRRSLFNLVSTTAVAVAVDANLPKASAARVRPDASAQSLQGAGLYAFRIGDIQVTLLSDGGFPMDLAVLFPKVDAGEREKALSSAFRPQAPIPGHVNALLIQTASQNVLVDTGCGTLFGPTTGKLLTHLDRAGLMPADISTVILTHLHGDHFGLLLDKVEFPFPNAKVILHENEVNFWTTATSLDKSMAPHDMQLQTIQNAQGVLGRVKQADRLVTTSAEKEVAPGVSLVPAPGHTPGHSLVQVASANQSLLYLADIVHAPAVQFAHPSWQILFDVDPDLAVLTRTKVLDRVVADRLLIAGTHLPFPALGHLEKRANSDGSSGFGFVPAVWEW